MPGKGSQAVPKGPSRLEERRVKGQAAAAQERAVWAIVDARDQRRCRVCGAWCRPMALSMLGKAHRHHLVYRSTGRTPATSAGLVTRCAVCHAEEHAHRIRLSGDGDARDPEGRLCGVTVERASDTGWTVEARV